MVTGEQLRQLRESERIGLRRLAARTLYSPSYLSMIETGSRPVTPDVITVYQQALGVSLDDEDVNRRSMLKLSAVALVDGDRLRAASANPAGAGRSAVADLRLVVDAIRHIEDEIGGASVLPIIRGIDTTTQSLAGERSPGRRAGVLAAEVARYRGWLELDTGNPTQADHCLDIAADLAQEFDDPTQVAHSRSFRAYSARRQGNISLAGKLTDAALTVRGVHPILTVYDRYQRAELHALAGEVRQAEKALIVADKAAGRAAEVELPDFGYWYTPGFWGFERGIVLAASGQRSAAVREASQGLAELPPGHASTGWAQDMLRRIDPDWD